MVKKKSTKRGHYEKPISLYPLTVDQALEALLAVKPEKKSDGAKPHSAKNKPRAKRKAVIKSEG